MKLSKWTFLIILANTTVFSEDIKIIGTIDHEFTITAPSVREKSETNIKHIKLLKLELSDAIKKTINYKLNHQPTLPPYKFANKNIASLQLGMSNVPVLDQGQHGTCATFAVTAAMNAILSKGDYISQLCLLQLGNALKQNAYISSGWKGSTTLSTLQRLKMFGIVNKVQQQAVGCGGLTKYPSQNPTAPVTEISLSDYHQISTPLDQTIAWSLIRDEYTRIDSLDDFEVIADVKTAIQAKNRIVFDVILADIKKGKIGAVGTFHTTNDSWILTAEIKKDIQDYLDGNNSEFEYGGHTMIVTGYDDDATVVDHQGKKHKGLFTLRSSWGKFAGDHGDFYMAYDYFAMFSMHAQRIRTSEKIN